MPIGRILLKSICGSRKLAALKSDSARLLYSWLIPNLDVHGCFSADPAVINGQVFTRLNKSIKQVSSWLDDLENVGLINRYQANGDTFLIVPDFSTKQPHLRAEREGKSNIPVPNPDQLQSNSGPTPAEVKLSKVNLSKDKEEDKERHLDFVLLTKSEYQKLVSEFGEKKTKEKILDLNIYLGKTRKKYSSHYYTILSWDRKESKDKNQDRPLKVPESKIEPLPDLTPEQIAENKRKMHELLKKVGG